MNAEHPDTQPGTHTALPIHVLVSCILNRSCESRALGSWRDEGVPLAEGEGRAMGMLNRSRLGVSRTDMPEIPQSENRL